MPAPRKFAVAVLGLRALYGAALVAAPGRLTRTWLGPSGTTGPTQVGVRGLGARETLLHVGALAAALRGTPLRPWLAASVLGDATDIASTLAARAELPDGSPLATVVVAGASAALTMAVAVSVSD